MRYNRLILPSVVLIALHLLSTPGYAQGAKGPDVIIGAPSDIEIVEQSSKLLRNAAEAGEFSGAVLIAKDGKLLYQEAFGFARLEPPIKNHVDTRFNVGSEGKMFTAVAIAQLAERGLLDFDDPLIKHLPDYPNSAAAGDITIHQLLTHTSGLGFYPFRHGAVDIDGVMRTFANDPLAVEPGTDFQYSNAGFLVLGVVVERVSRMPYFEYLRRHIFEPAGMHDTGDFVGRSNDPTVAIPYRLDDETGERVSALPLLEPFASPAGGSYSTVGDMLRFAEALGSNVLLVAEMTANVLHGKVDMGPPGLKYAYGFGEHVVNGHRSIGHNGGAPGVAADFKVFVDDGYTTVLFSNFGGREAMELARAIESLIVQ